MKTKNIATKIAILLLVVMLLPIVLADVQFSCIGRGETIEFSLCNPTYSDYTCGTTSCQTCVNEIAPGVYCPSNKCNSLGLTCSSNTDTTVDQTKPVLEILSPILDEVYSGRSALLELEVSETADIYFIDNQNNRGRWTRVCTDCSSYSRTRSFSEGLNDLTFRARDRTGNTAYFNHSFYIDSKKPRIRSTEPRSGFASGLFKIEFQEANPELLTLNYGNSQTGMRSSPVNLGECVEGRNTECEVQVDLADYEEQTISYFFVLEDMAGSTVQSRTTELEVDNTDPDINFDFEVDGKKVVFSLNVTETNFKEILYIDNADSRPKWKRLCSTPICEKKINFKDGFHEVDIKVTDKAGNEAKVSAVFSTDSKKPKISKIEPTRGFASGEFYVKFDEANPMLLVLEYGTEANPNHLVINIENSCTLGKRHYECLSTVDLSEYNGEEIEYSFTLTDFVGQQDTKGKKNLPVDTVLPVINDISHSMSGSRAEITLSITEENFKKATYINNADSRPRERTFCSRLSNGECKKRISLRPGLNSINFTVLDDAGNSVAQNYMVTL